MHISELAHLTKAQRAKVLAGLSADEAEALLKDWSFHARQDQLPPMGDWRGWLYLAGRGAGKTRSGAEWVRAKVKAGCRRIGMISPTTRDARTVMVEGESGMLATSWEKDIDDKGNHMGRPVWHSSRGELTWANGALATLYTAEEPERLRGPQHDALWMDELAAWYTPQVGTKNTVSKRGAQEVWDMAMFGLRLGANPQFMVSTTPKPIPLVREMVKSPNIVITRATTYDNKANLAKSFISQIISKYEGTRLGRQELLAEVIDEVEGALWTRAMLDAARLDSAPELRRIVVAIDPAVTSAATSNLTGIVVAGVGRDNRGYVLRDASGQFSPGDWAAKAIALYDEFGADRIVAEGNQGGDMVRHTLQSARANVPITIVHASRGKQARAEPVAALYEQGKVKHVGALTELEDQLATWEPLSGQASPDRLDALVWALTNLMLGAQDVPVVVPFVHFMESTLPY